MLFVSCFLLFVFFFFTIFIFFAIYFFRSSLSLTFISGNIKQKSGYEAKRQNVKNNKRQETKKYCRTGLRIIAFNRFRFFKYMYLVFIETRRKVLIKKKKYLVQYQSQFFILLFCNLELILFSLNYKLLYYYNLFKLFSM